MVRTVLDMLLIELWRYKIAHYFAMDKSLIYSIHCLFEFSSWLFQMLTRSRLLIELKWVHIQLKGFTIMHSIECLHVKFATILHTYNIYWITFSSYACELGWLYLLIFWLRGSSWRWVLLGIRSFDIKMESKHCSSSSFDCKVLIQLKEINMDFSCAKSITKLDLNCLFYMNV